MESDCATLVGTLQNGGQERAAWADLIRNGCTFNHVKRDANMAAHELAKRAMHNQEWVVQRHETPDEIRSLVMTETAGEEQDPPDCNMNLFC
jgi:hypothetical protein